MIESLLLAAIYLKVDLTIFFNVVIFCSTYFKQVMFPWILSLSRWLSRLEVCDFLYENLVKLLILENFGIDRPMKSHQKIFQSTKRKVGINRTKFSSNSSENNNKFLTKFSNFKSVKNLKLTKQKSPSTWQLITFGWKKLDKKPNFSEISFDFRSSHPWNFLYFLAGNSNSDRNYFCRKELQKKNQGWLERKSSKICEKGAEWIFWFWWNHGSQYMSTFLIAI